MPKRMYLTALMILSLSCLLPMALSCQKSSKKTTGPLTYTIADPVGDWGYPSLYGMYPRGPGYIHMSLLFDTLIWKDQTGLVPALAKEWKYLADEGAYLFRLREGITFHDGQPFSANDVTFTFLYVKKHPWMWVDSEIIKSAEKIDQQTVKISLNTLYAPFLTNIAGVLPILPKHIWEDIENPGQFLDKRATVGTGPYRLLDYNKAQGTYLYEAYDHYYQGKPIAERIKFLKISQETAPAALKRGEVNASSIPPEIMEQVKGWGFTIEEEPPSWAATLMINHRKAPLSRKAFRQALAYAIDLDEIVAIVKKGHAVRGNPGLMPPSNSTWYEGDVAQYEYKPAKAKGLLETMGYRKTESGHYQKGGQALNLELLIGSVSQPEFVRVGEMIKKHLEQVGIMIDLRSLESKTVDAKIEQWDYDLAISGYGGLGSDPDILQRVIIGENFSSARFYQNEQLVNLLKKQVHQMDRKERRESIGTIQQLYAEELPSLTLYYPKWYWAHDGTVDLYYTKGGLALGIPVPLNKLSFLPPKGQ